jgi:glutathione S-transferase
MELLRFVDLDLAVAAPGLRLVVAGALPSPWSEGAKALFHVKELPVLAVRYRRDQAAALTAATGARNVPVLLHDGDPPRTGWAEILALAERLGGARPLVPSEPALRVRHIGLLHELASEGGLGWSARLIMIHGGLESSGARGFPLPVAQFLAPRYGYAPERIPAARARIAAVAKLLDEQLAASHAAGQRYLFGDQLTALDLYLATFLTPIVGVTEAECPNMRPEVRPAFAHLNEEMGAALSPALVAHRRFVYEQHLPWPIVI